MWRSFCGLPLCLVTVPQTSILVRTLQFHTVHVYQVVFLSNGVRYFLFHCFENEISKNLKLFCKTIWKDFVVRLWDFYLWSNMINVFLVQDVQTASLKNPCNAFTPTVLLFWLLIPSLASSTPNNFGNKRNCLRYCFFRETPLTVSTTCSLYPQLDFLKNDFT